MMDNNLTFELQVENICKKLYSSLFVVKSLARFCEASLLISVYHALIMSHITYRIIVWSCCNNSSLEKVFRLQKRAIRYIFKLKGVESCRPFFLKHQLMTSPLMVVFKYVKHYLSLLKNSNVTLHQHNTRYAKK